MRSLNSNAADALESGALGLAMFVELEFQSGTLRLNTTRSNIANPESPAELYTGIGGTVGSIASVSDEVRGTTGIELSLNGVDPSVIAIALGEPVRGRPIKLYVGVIAVNTWALLDLIQIWAGHMSMMSVSEQDNLATVKLAAEHRGVQFARARPERYTDADQQRRYPGDRCLEFLPKQSQVQDTWPAASYFAEK